MSTDRKTAIDLLLLQHPGAARMHEPVSRVGGWPLVPRGCQWPLCAECGLPMQFTLQLRLRDLGGPFVEADGLLLVWRCDGAALACDSSRPFGGNNFATIVTLRDLVLLEQPGRGGTIRSRALELWPVSRPLWQKLEVVGRVTQVPDWLDEPEDVECPACRVQMRSMLQLEPAQGECCWYDRGYVFFCELCCDTAWLSQQYEGLPFDEDGDPDEEDGN